MIATHRRALITEMFERVLPAVELIDGDRGRVSDTLTNAHELTITVVWP